MQTASNAMFVESMDSLQRCVRLFMIKLLEKYLELIVGIFFGFPAVFGGLLLVPFELNHLHAHA
jgi:hypothetical protein